LKKEFLTKAVDAIGMYIIAPIAVLLFGVIMATVYPFYLIWVKLSKRSEGNS